MEEYFYYIAFVSIGILCVWGAVLTVITVVQAVLVARSSTKPDGAYFSISTQFLHGLVTLVVGLLLLKALLSETVPTWILLVGSILFSLVESGLFRYHQRLQTEQNSDH
jgi:hypothetical protein